MVHSYIFAFTNKLFWVVVSIEKAALSLMSSAVRCLMLAFLNRSVNIVLIDQILKLLKIDSLLPVYVGSAIGQAWINSVW